MLINAVMPVRDRPQQTMKCIPYITGGDCRLTIVDDTSQAYTVGVLDAFQSLWPQHVHVVHNTENLGVGGSKNRGVEESEKRFGRGDYLYFSDNDVLFEPYWIEKLIAAYEVHSKENRFRIIGGYAHPYNGTNESFVANHPGNLYNGQNEITVHEKNAVDGLSWLLKWDTWDRYGKLMDNARGVRQSEDWEYCQRIIKDGYRVGVVYPHVVINNGIVDTFGERIPGADQVEAIEKARMPA